MAILPEKIRSAPTSAAARAVRENLLDSAVDPHRWNDRRRHHEPAKMVFNSALPSNA